MGASRKSYGDMFGSFMHDTSTGPPGSIGQYCGSHVKIQDNKVWRWSENREWVRSTIEVATINHHLITKCSSNSKRS